MPIVGNEPDIADIVFEGGDRKVVAICILAAAGCANHQQNGSADAPGGSSTDTQIGNTPFSAETRFAAGQMAETQGNPRAAIVQYQEALKLNPNHLGALYRLGVVYAQMKQFQPAVAAWEQYVEATGQAATAFADLGFCEELAGFPDKAEYAYMAGIAQDPKCVPCRVNYGLMLARKGQINQAIAQWRFVLSEAEIHYNLGGIYASQGRKEQAKLEFNEAMKLDPKLTDAKARVAALDKE